MSDDKIKKRLERYERILGEQQQIIETQREIIETQRAHIEKLQADTLRSPSVVVTDGGNIKVVGEIDADNGTGILGRATGSGTTYGVRGEATSDEGYGLATPDDANIGGVAELTRLGGDLTGGTPLETLLGRGLTIENGTLSVVNEIGETGLVADDTAESNAFGSAVSASRDGLTVVTGVAENESGEQVVYLSDLTSNPPTVTELSASDAKEGDKFGYAVDISNDGSTVVVGAYRKSVDGVEQGKAYVYDLSTSPPAVTELLASDADTGDRFGYTVNLSGDGTTAVVGAPLKTVGRGKTYVYDLTTSPPTETELTHSDSAGGDWFGAAVSVNNDGSTVLVGASRKGSNQTYTGKAYVYDLTTNPPTETELVASDGEGEEAKFGHSVSITGDGLTAIVGAPWHNSTGTKAGKAYVYDLTTNSPTETKLTASDISERDNFGRGVDINSDGSTVLVGADRSEALEDKPGKAYVYNLMKDPPDETELLPSDSTNDDYFGSAVSLSAGGSTAVLGAPGRQPGKAYSFTAGFELSF